MMYSRLHKKRPVVKCFFDTCLLSRGAISLSEYLDNRGAGSALAIYKIRLKLNHMAHPVDRFVCRFHLEWHKEHSHEILSIECACK